MRNGLLLGCVAAVIAALGVSVSDAQRKEDKDKDPPKVRPVQPPDGVRIPVRAKWEYKALSKKDIVDLAKGFAEGLNHLGEEGWELVAMDMGENPATYIFKRSKAARVVLPVRPRELDPKKEAPKVRRPEAR